MNDISFTSRINFVDRKVFENFRKGAYIDFRAQQEFNACDLITLKNIEKMSKGRIKHPRLDVLKADEFFTEGLRTCAGGGIIDTKSGEAAGFHAYDSLENLENADDILENLFGHVPNADRALLIGSKNLKMSIYSCPLFQKLLAGIQKRVKNVTIIREHLLPFSESDIHYSSKNDTWTIHTMGKPLTDYREFDVTSRELLDKSFKEVKLADGDVLEFNAIV